MTRITSIISLVLAVIVLSSCENKETAQEILSKTICSIDTIETIYYKQDMLRTNPRQPDDTIFRYREMYFKSLLSDSIVGVQGHWYLYSDGRHTLHYEDVYDGNKLIRKNNLDSVALLYDLVKFPAFREKHFWSHNTLYGMQYSFRQMLENRSLYTFERLHDTIFMGQHCYQIVIYLEDKTTMPGFAWKPEDSEGSVSRTLYFIDSRNYYPVRMLAENYSAENPDQKSFIDQIYYDIEFNLEIDENMQFDTSSESLIGYEIKEIQPQIDG